MSVRAFRTVKSFSDECIFKKVLLNDEVFNLNCDFEVFEVFKKYGMCYINDDNLGELEISKDNLNLALNDNISNDTKLILNNMLDSLNETDDDWFFVTTM